ncbi:MAG: DEAD/DEAH box helicase [Verrucomicrobia bacterium]|nr:DEAD/DEAH box helicase [Verrucomicrobiota bacterium]
MLNFRKLRQDFSSNVVKEGRELYDKQKVVAAKILHLDHRVLRISGRVQGQYENHYESEIEIDRLECETIDSDCDCPYNYDCQHLAALVFYLEERLDEIMVAYSKETDIGQIAEKNELSDEQRTALINKFKEAETKQSQKQEEHYQKQVLQEYVSASEMLSVSPFFRPSETYVVDSAEAMLIFAPPPSGDTKNIIECQIALRLPSRSKPLHIPYVKKFFEAMRYEEPIFIGTKRYSFSLASFKGVEHEIMRMLMEQARYPEQVSAEKGYRILHIDQELFGFILASVHEKALSENAFSGPEEELPELPGLYEGNFDTPLRYSSLPSTLKFFIEYMKPPVSKILLRPLIVLHDKEIDIASARLLECAKPGMLHQNTYYRFDKMIQRTHLKSLLPIEDMTIPEPLFGSFVENALPQLSHFAKIENRSAIEDFVTLPFAGPIKATCEIVYLDGQLEASLFFHYEGHRVPASATQLTYDDAATFVSKQGILARDLVEERKILDGLFQDFIYNPAEGMYIAKSEKKIVEFMTDVIPRFQDRVTFNCPQNLLDQFIYDQSKFKLLLGHTDRIDLYEIQLKVSGSLKGIKMDQLWECIASRRPFIELDTPKPKTKKGEGGKIPKILVLDLEKITALVQLFDELGIDVLDDHTMQRPLWSLANIDASHFKGLPVQFSMTEQLVDIRKQMLGEKVLEFTPTPMEIQATLRNYQTEGVHWLERLRLMYLNGILADDMGLGKTLQAIVAIAQYQSKNKAISLVVCPTSLLYNWKEELAKFDPELKVIIVDGVPSARKRLIEGVAKYDIVITSYTLLQKDVETYNKHHFGYVILDEAQHIKNRGTRNAKSVKMIRAHHRLILSGTPIENSLDELWSLFDFLMPGFLSSYDRFVEKYIRVTGAEQTKNLEYLRKKVAPFILRRMKNDVLDDLPPVSEIVYHCQLSDVQQELYRSYAASARDELVKLVERDGFDRVQIHVLATLTRLKQICCHPAIFAKEKAENGDSAKYEMLLELLQTLVEGKHKTVIFSQYTRMLQIMRTDLQQRGIRFEYLDGSSKNRLEIVKKFNEDESIPVFLVSLKAGGTGLNLVGADTVIHYDMWWNPAVENQATDRVHRIGQKKNVSAYKLITVGTIEEKIAEMQKRKKGLVKKVVSCDDEAIAKLTWEDVLELLRT